MKTPKILKGLLLTLFAVIAIMVFASPEMAHFYAYVGLTPDLGSGISIAASPLTIAFAKDIQENLYPDNEFYKQSKDDSIWVKNNEVRLPQAGAAPNVEVDRAVIPAQVKRREDTAEAYYLQEFTTDPILIQDTEEMQLSYAKRVSVLGDHTNQLNTSVADNFAQIWMPTLATNMVRTTGTAAAATATGATGNRLKVIDADWIKAVTLMDRMDIPANDRFACIPASMYGQLLEIDKFVNYQTRGLVDLVGKGFIGELYGIKLFKRSRLAVYDNTGTPVKKAFGAATTTADNEAILIWHKDKVRRAEGGVKVFHKEDDPTMYGSIYSAMVNAGGRIARADQKGVVAIIQAAG